jgi:hypothetical protein
MAQKRLDYLTRALVVKLRALEPERSLASIAEACGCSEPSVRRILQAHTTDTKTLTRDLLQSGVLDRLDDWAMAARVSARKGFHKGSRDWLEAAEVVTRAPAASVNVDARPTIVVNVPFQLGALQPTPAPALELPPVDTHDRTLAPGNDTP